jgi:DNA repair exonuclease SbcCD ATPase subunit
MNGRREVPKVMPMPVSPQPNIPAPAARPNVAQHQVYAEEALKAHQRVIDMMQEIDRAGQELEEMRRRALLAEAEVKRLEEREHTLQQQLERRTQELTDERDSYRFRLSNLTSQFETAGSIILKCLEASRKDASIVDLDKLQAEVEDHIPMPKIVAQGPRGPEENEPKA